MWNQSTNGESGLPRDRGGLSGRCGAVRSTRFDITPPVPKQCADLPYFCRRDVAKHVRHRTGFPVWAYQASAKIVLGAAVFDDVIGF